MGLRERVGAANGDGDAGTGKHRRVVDAVADHQGVFRVVRFQEHQFGGGVEAAVPVFDAVAGGKTGDVVGAVAAGNGEVVAGFEQVQCGGEVGAFRVAQLVVGA